MQGRKAPPTVERCAELELFSERLLSPNRAISIHAALHPEVPEVPHRGQKHSVLGVWLRRPYGRIRHLLHIAKNQVKTAGGRTILADRAPYVT